jgi:Holliday junction resolvase RusA-like endonuclease
MNRPVVALSLPVPPSVNALYRNVPRRGRVKTRAYRQWLNSAGWEIQLQRQGCIGAGFEVEITLPLKTRGDIDNRVKPTLDALTKFGVIRDDRDCRSITVRKGDLSEMLVTLRAAP